MLCLSFGFPFLALKGVKSLVSIYSGWQHLFCCCQSSHGVALWGRNSWPTACTPHMLLQHHWKCSMIFETQLRSVVWCNVLEWIQIPDCLVLNYYTFLLNTRPASALGRCESCSFIVATSPGASAQPWTRQRPYQHKSYGVWISYLIFHASSLIYEAEKKYCLV